MVRFFKASAVCAIMSGILAACQPAIPDSGQGVGFDSPTSARAQSLPPPQPVQSAPLTTAANPQPAAAPVRPAAPVAASTPAAAAPLPASVTAAVTGTPAPQPVTAADAAQESRATATAAAANSGVAPVDASPSNPAPELVNSAGISREQDFDSVSSQRSIESDANRIAQNRAQYTVIAPTDLPTRSGTNQPNIVEYALRTNHPVGAQLYRRVNLRSAQRHAQACAAFASPDQAQIDFLARGGPERDRKGLDPDGDGFACSWNPAPFRKARAAAQPAATPAPGVAAQPNISTEG